MGRIWIENKGLGLFRARRKNSRKWLEGYYVRVLETAGCRGRHFDNICLPQPEVDGWQQAEARVTHKHHVLFYIR